MSKYFRTIFLFLSLVILVFFTLFVITQTAQVVQLAAGVHPLFGKIVLFTLLTIYFLLIAVPAVWYWRTPRALIPPAEKETAEFAAYLARLSKRLQKNPLLRGQPLDSERDIEAALQILNRAAVRQIKQNANVVFVSTAISQSGRLDAFTVLMAQIRMIWQVARLYNQRPPLPELLRLYANVGATAFAASELNDIDINEQINPIITSVLGSSVTGALPGVNLVAGIVTNSLLTGAANAYLTLRVGFIARQYCGLLVRKERNIIRRTASLQAARLLSVIVMNSAGNITKSIANAAWKGPGKISRTVLRSTWGKIAGKNKPELEFPDMEP